MPETLLDKIASRRARVGVIGLGYVGLPLAMEFALKGFTVTGFDLDRAKVRGLSAGRSHIPDVPAASVADAVRRGRFRATDRFEALARMDAVVICVPTPLRKTKEPDLTFIVSACEALAPRLRKGQLVVLESTTYPGTTSELVRPLFEKRGLKAGRDFHLAFSPERVDPANKTYRIANTPKVVGGLTPACGRAAQALYGAVVERVVPVSSTEAAEMVKLLENTFRAVNIAMVNEMAVMCHRLGVDIWEIVAAASTKPFGFMPFYPGPGLGGHCIPVDPSYLAWKMKSLNFEPRFIELAATINSRMPDYAVERLTELLNERRRALKGSRILVLGAAYKPDVNDVRESPSLDVMKLLMDRGARVSYHDPYIPAVSVGPRRLRSAPLTEASLRACDAALILTAHRRVDYGLVLAHAPLVFDARNATAGRRRRNLERL
ncbi:MAG: nucleotide sugar dehydrogenase [Elusimicrobia bacterium]|nr:nucleotide sugar dehydrogenase [Elusimicrobiota bacterium]